eukprot:TRINITY_DN14100_c0_g1_i1.p1 TRINITY_DN14100_c0_g1~~TRINITY_DN14100_c0_g1_i1.p1  ORF type:complete len:417 (-),score=86.63 TRINITY_DN14100_c0_g1_i1:3-1253(-)
MSSPPQKRARADELVASPKSGLWVRFIADADPPAVTLRVPTQSTIWDLTERVASLNPSPQLAPYVFSRFSVYALPEATPVSLAELSTPPKAATALQPTDQPEGTCFFVHYTGPARCGNADGSVTATAGAVAPAAILNAAGAAAVPYCDIDMDEVDVDALRLPATHPRRLVPALCRQFHGLGWVTGTGGGISIRLNDDIYIAPSGVQKERLRPADMFVCTLSGADVVLPPPARALKKSQCTPLFLCAYTQRKAAAVIHTHSQHAVMATLRPSSSAAAAVKGGAKAGVDSAALPTEFVITHQEMIKGIRNDQSGKYLRFHDILRVPIIENTPDECDLEGRMAECLEKYPETSAVLVRRHGVYVWGPTWEKAKTMCECYDYLFEVAGRLAEAGIDAATPPTDCPYLAAEKAAADSAKPE